MKRSIFIHIIWKFSRTLRSDMILLLHLLHGCCWCCGTVAFAAAISTVHLVLPMERGGLAGHIMVARVAVSCQIQMKPQVRMIIHEGRTKSTKILTWEMDDMLDLISEAVIVSSRRSDEKWNKCKESASSPSFEVHVSQVLCQKEDNWGRCFSPVSVIQIHTESDSQLLASTTCTKSAWESTNKLKRHPKFICVHLLSFCCLWNWWESTWSSKTCHSDRVAHHEQWWLFVAIQEHWSGSCYCYYWCCINEVVSTATEADQTVLQKYVMMILPLFLLLQTLEFLILPQTYRVKIQVHLLRSMSQ